MVKLVWTLAVQVLHQFFDILSTQQVTTLVNDVPYLLLLKSSMLQSRLYN